LREKVIEEYLVARCKENYGICVKFTSPGNPGMPDRLCIFYKNRFVLVELKSPVGKLSDVQKLQHRRLAELGVDVYTLNSKAGVDLFIEALREKGII
jgi:hypothetical protein